MSLRTKVLAVVIAVSAACGPLEGISEKPCRPGCVDHETRLVCENGSPKAVLCPASAEPCATPRCSEGTCGLEPATGAACGPGGLARCNEGYACVGPKLRLSAFHTHTCALADDGKVWCWGDNQYGELGDGTTNNSGYPVWVRLPRRAVDVSTGYSHSCAVLDDGTAYCWGANTGGRTAPTLDSEGVLVPTKIDAPAFRFSNISCGWLHTCALTTSTTVVCWGSTTKGQCGIDGEVTGLQRTPPVEIPHLDLVRALEAGLSHTCALRSGTPNLVCWGSNASEFDGNYIDGKLGSAADGLTHSALPVPVALGVPVLNLGLGYESTYAMAAGDITYAWGSNSRKQLGIEDDVQWTSAPKPVMHVDEQGLRPLPKVVGLPRSSGSGACARMQDFSLGTRYFCWGGDDHGELGFGAAEAIPRQYANPTSVLPASAGNMARGDSHACVTVDEGAGTEIRCFGLIAMVANGTTDHVANQLLPMPVQWRAENAQEFLTR